METIAKTVAAKELSRLMTERRTVHRFMPSGPISQGIIDEALRLSLFAPNHRLTYPWRYIQVGAQARERIIAAETERREELGAFAEERQLKLRAAIMNPSCVIAALTPCDGGDYRDREDYATISCGLQNLSLYLWAMGIASKWSTGAFTTTAATMAILGADPSAYACAGFIFIGHPETVPAAAKRPELAEVLTHLD